MWRKLIARYLLLARAILPLLRHTRGAARGRRKSPRRLLGLGSAAFSPFYCDKNPDGERPAFWKTGLLRWPLASVRSALRPFVAPCVHTQRPASLVYPQARPLYMSNPAKNLGFIYPPICHLPLHARRSALRAPLAALARCVA